MAKQKRETSLTVPGHGHVTHCESNDDNLLPSPEELKKLKEVDPRFIDWILEHASKEQSHRHDFQNGRLRLISKGQGREHRIDLIAIFCALIIILAGMVFSYLIIDKEHIILGSVFAGATLLLAANSFLNIRKKKQDTKK